MGLMAAEPSHPHCEGLWAKRCKHKIIFLTLVLPLLLGSALVNPVEICYDFSPSKPVLHSDVSLRRTSSLHPFA